MKLQWNFKIWGSSWETDGIQPIGFWRLGLGWSAWTHCQGKPFTHFSPQVCTELLAGVKLSTWMCAYRAALEHLVFLCNVGGFGLLHMERQSTMQRALWPLSPWWDLTLRHLPGFSLCAILIERWLQSTALVNWIIKYHVKESVPTNSNRNFPGDFKRVLAHAKSAFVFTGEWKFRSDLQIFNIQYVNSSLIATSWHYRTNDSTYRR